MYRMKHRTKKRSAASARVALGAAAVGAATVLLAGPAATAATVSTPPPLPNPVMMAVPTPYDDLSSTLCDGTNAIAVSKIQSIDGFATDIYALAGDTVELVGLVKACQTLAAPTDARQWGFTDTEVTWTKTLVGGTENDLGPQTVVQSGRTAIPTTTKTSETLTPADDGARIIFGVPSRVTSPNGRDRVSSDTTLFLHVLNPQLGLTKEVCATGTGCDIDDDSAWLPETATVTGSDVQWRLTATNLGNVPLTGVTVDQDDLTGGTAADNACAGKTIAADLAVGASASIACTTTSVTGTGWVVNTAELTSAFTDPSPNGRLLARFTDGVRSGTADARVESTPAPTPPPGDPGTPPGTGGDNGTAGGNGGGGLTGSNGSGTTGTAGTGGKPVSTGAAVLASTGFDGAPVALAALALAVAGGALLLLRRRFARG